MNRTHQASSQPCTGGAKEGFNNCFDRNSVRKMASQSDAEIIMGIVTSGCLSMNHTRAGANYVKQRLEEIARKVI